MKSLIRSGVAAIVLALLAAPALAQRHAQPRSGGSSGGGGRSGAPGAHGPSAGSPSRSAGGSGAVSRGSAHRPTGSFSGSGSGPHRPTGSRFSHGGHGGRHYGHGYHYPYYPRYSFGFSFYYPYYYPYYYAPYYYGYYGYPYYSPYYPYYSRRYVPYDYGYGEGAPASYDRQDLGAVALKVKPRSAEVYVNGRYLGAAGSFDGFPGYLWLEPGRYDLTLVYEGYANLEREIEITPGQVIDFKMALEPGVAERPRGEAYDPEEWRARPYDDERGEGDRYREEDRYRENDRYREDAGRDRGAPELPDARPEAGLVFDVRPDDASVYVDGRFVGTASEVSSARAPFPVAPGEHTVEVVHPGFETQRREITVRAGDERLLEVTLRRDGGV